MNIILTTIDIKIMKIHTNWFKNILFKRENTIDQFNINMQISDGKLNEKLLTI